MRTRILILVLLLTALCVVPAAASAASKTETKTSGQVSVVLTYKTGRSPFDVTKTQIKITRAGVTLLDAAVAEPCRDCGVAPSGYMLGKSIQIADIDGDGEPEVLLDLYTGGMHCCTNTWIYRYTGSAYASPARLGGEGGSPLKDLNGDGIPELRSSADRFAYAFAPYVASWFPPMVLQYRAGTFTDVTRSFPALAAKDAARALRVYRRRTRHQDDQRGVVAAYVADQYLLGHPARGWKLARSANKHGALNGLGRGDQFPRNGRFLKSLRKFLAKTGYS